MQVNLIQRFYDPQVVSAAASKGCIPISKKATPTYFEDSFSKLRLNKQELGSHVDIRRLTFLKEPTPLSTGQLVKEYSKAYINM